MKRIHAILLTVIASFTSVLLAEIPKDPLELPVRKPNGPTRDIASTSQELNAWMLIPQASIISPWSFVLETPQYRVPYSDNFAGFPMLSLGVGKAISQIGNFHFSGEGRVGFAYKSGAVGYTDAAGGSHKDTLSLMDLPVSGAVKLMYYIPDLNFLKPTLAVGMGMHWLHQAGKGVNVSDDFLLPFYLISPGLTFLESRSPRDWFGGFNFSLTFMNTFATSQTIRGVSFDLGLNILL